MDGLTPTGGRDTSNRNPDKKDVDSDVESNMFCSGLARAPSKNETRRPLTKNPLPVNVNSSQTLLMDRQSVCVM